MQANARTALTHATGIETNPAPADISNERNYSNRHPSRRPLHPKGRPPPPPTTQWGIPCSLEGKSGIGKSQITKQVSKMLKLPFQSMFAGTHMPEDFSGVTVPDGRGVARCAFAISPKL